MHAPLARLSRAPLALIIAGCLAALLTPSTARASHYLVDINGGGDFTNIQPAIDQLVVSPRDSILVSPGEYPDTLRFSFAIPTVVIVGSGGPAVTTASSIDAPRLSSSSWHVVGLTYAKGVSLDGIAVEFRSCVFLGRVNSVAAPGGPNFHNCDFCGRTWLECYDSSNLLRFDGLHFHSAPLHASTCATGPVSFENCSFEGPADTLVLARGSTPDAVIFSNCHFKTASNGVVCNGVTDLESCVVQDIAGNAIWLEQSNAECDTTTIHDTQLFVSNSRFERCGSAIRWLPCPASYAPVLGLVADTVLSSTGDALTIAPDWAHFPGHYLTNLLVDGAEADGIVIRLRNQYSALRLVHSRVTHVAGDGIRLIAETTTASDPPWFTSTVWDCQSDHNGGAGFRLDATGVSVVGNVAWANSGDGIVLQPGSYPPPDMPDSLASNTCVLNGGDGLRVESPNPPTGSPVVVQRNLSVLNARYGGAFPTQSPGSFAFNDAWDNYVAPFVGAWSSLDSNLTVDPRLCDLASGDLGLQQGSPCGAGGLYGLIGALPESCPNTTAVATTTPRLSFSVRPTIAQGSVEFVPPSVGSAGRVEVLDLSGRRIWGAALGPATGTLRWRGQSDNGRAQPGLYWVRFTRAGESQSRRLVWLR